MGEFTSTNIGRKPGLSGLRLVRLVKAALDRVRRRASIHPVAPSETAAHHPIFSQFSAFKGTAAAGCDRDYIGATARRSYLAAPPRDMPIQVDVPLPAFDEEYFEWIDLLESVAAARGQYTMMELGAGYGRWSIRAALAARQRGTIPCRLIAVEAEPVHFEWLRTHFRDNGLDPDAHTLLQAAVSDSTGAASFCVGSPLGNDAPDLWYGQALVKNDEAAQLVEHEKYAGIQVRRDPNGWKSIAVRKVSLQDLLAPLDQVDLIDLDLQGEELIAIRSAIEGLDKKVKRLHIGTHSTEIEAGLRKILSKHGWRSLADYACGGPRETPYGTIHFGDGVQSWLNPRL